MGAPPKVKIAETIQHKPERRRTPRVVRWTVGGEPKARGFENLTLARAFKTRLEAAHLNAETFDVPSGVPVSWLESSSKTVAEWCVEHVRRRWDHIAPRYRKSYVESLARLIGATTMKGEPATQVALVAWLSTVSEGAQASAPVSLKHSLQLSQLDARTAGPASELVERALVNGRVSATGQLLGKSTQARHRSVIGKCLKSAVTELQLPANPWPKPERDNTKAAKKARAAKVVDVRKLPSMTVALAVVNGLENRNPSSRTLRMATLMILLAGLRPSEVLALEIEDLELPAEGFGSVRVHRSLTGAGRQWGTEEEDRGDTKTSSERDVPLHPWLVGQLRGFLPETCDGQVFATRRGTPITSQNWNRALQAQAGGEAFTAYLCRHLCASQLLFAGVDPAEVARRMGHTVETLMRVYVGVMPEAAEAANRKYEAHLQGVLPDEL